MKACVVSQFPYHYQILGVNDSDFLGGGGAKILPNISATYHDNFKRGSMVLSLSFIASLSFLSVVHRREKALVSSTIFGNVKLD
jgi:hypothetical protein